MPNPDHAARMNRALLSLDGLSVGDAFGSMIFNGNPESLLPHRPLPKSPWKTTDDTEMALGITEVPVILCDEWTPSQVKAFRLMVNRSVTWADWDDELLALELQELSESDFDLSFTGFDPKEIDDLLLLPDDDDRADAAPPLPEKTVARLGDLWLCGKHRVLCGDSTSPGDVARLLGDRQPFPSVLSYRLRQLVSVTAPRADRRDE